MPAPTASAAPFVRPASSARTKAAIWRPGPSAVLIHVLIGGVTIALVSFADTSVLSRTYAARLGVPVDPNQEMVGLGAANLAAGFFQGFPISSSSSRTPVAEAAGARTQMTGLVGAIAIALLLVLAPDLLQHLPSTALAAVVIAAAIGLIEVADLRRIYRIQRWEFWLSMVFHDRVLDAVADSPTPARWLVITAEPVTSVDVTAADVVGELADRLHAAGVELCFAEMKDPVKDKLKRFGLFARLGEDAFFPTIGEAVRIYLDRHHIEWEDRRVRAPS